MLKKYLMKELITFTKFRKEIEGKFGTMYLHDIHYLDKKATYMSKVKDQNKFVLGQEAEFTEEERTKGDYTYLNVKPINDLPKSGFQRQQKKEQIRYSSMGVSYVKDLIIAGKVEIKDWEKASEKIIRFMFKIDKEND